MSFKQHPQDWQRWVRETLAGCVRSPDRPQALIRSEFAAAQGTAAA